MKIIGITGGSGTGKSTVADLIVGSDPERFMVIHFDDYQRLRSETGLPQMAGMINWDHPDIIDWPRLLADIQKQSQANDKPVLIVEGYLIFSNPDLVKLLDKSFYLDLDQDTRLLRRGQKPVGSNDYNHNVLLPMHAEHIEPHKQHVDKLIHVAGMTAEEVSQQIIEDLAGLF